jgi:hypothetical protein
MQMRSVFFSALLMASTLAGCTGCTPPGPDGGPTGTGVVLINELMAKNQTTIADNAGAFPDWLELYNPGDEAVSLAGWTLTDDATEPGKFTFAAGTVLASRAFTLVWADGDPEEGEDHADFKLSGDGEELALFDDEGALADLVTFGPQEVDVSIGRYPDGADEIQVLPVPTPGTSNVVSGDGGVVVDAGPDAGVDAGAPATTVVINEVVLPPGTVVTDHEQLPFTTAWVELWNTGSAAVSLEGHYLSEVDIAGAGARIGAAAEEIPAGGSLVFLLGIGTTWDWLPLTPEAPVHLYLRGPGGEPIDDVSVDDLAPGTSWARLPDGTGAFGAGEPTPRRANEARADAGPADAGDLDAGETDAADVGAGDGGVEADAGDLDAGDVDASAP